MIPECRALSLLPRVVYNTASLNLYYTQERQKKDFKAMTTSITVAVIDYGMGNLHSVAKALEHASPATNRSVKVLVTSDQKLIANADRVLLPGVGSMRDCMGEMQRLDLIHPIKFVIYHRKHTYHST